MTDEDDDDGAGDTGLQLVLIRAGRILDFISWLWILSVRACVSVTGVSLKRCALTGFPSMGFVLG